MRDLMRITEVYRVDTEAEAAQLIQEFKDEAKSGGYMVGKYESKHRTKKKNGEVIEEWYVATVQKDFVVEE